jgi:hypothetical protein
MKGETMVTAINTAEFRRNGKTPVFEGYQHGDVPVSFFLVDAPPGSGPACTAIPMRRCPVPLTNRGVMVY